MSEPAGGERQTQGDKFRGFAPAQAMTGDAELGFGSGPEAGGSGSTRASGGGLSMAQRFLAGGGTPQKRETQGNRRVTHLPPP